MRNSHFSIPFTVLKLLDFVLGKQLIERRRGRACLHTVYGLFGAKKKSRSKRAGFLVSVKEKKFKAAPRFLEPLLVYLITNH